MKMKTDCISCFMQQAVRAANLSVRDFKKRIMARKEAAQVISNLDHTKTPPEIATGVFKRIAQVTGNPDAFKNLKDESNKNVMELMDMARELIAASNDRFEAAVKVSLCGNIIDYGILDDFDVKALIKKEINEPLDGAKIQKLKDMVISSSIISFFADNAGEIGFDSILLRECKSLNPNLNIIIFVKSAPIINDATMDDARFFNLDSEFKVMVTASSVGMNMALLSPDARRLIEKSNCIIAKGQANYEILTEQGQSPAGTVPIVYLLRAKCDVVAEHIGVKKGSRVLIV